MSFPLSDVGIRGAAEQLVAKVRSHRSRACCLWLSPSYEVTIESIEKSWRQEPEPPGEWLVGIYTMRAQLEDVVEDVRARVNELKATAQLPLFGGDR